MQNEIIVVKQLVKYIANKQILKQVDFSIAKGESVAIVGANGAGKSTLLRIICGLSQPSSGALYLANNDFSQIGFAADTPPLYSHDTVYSYLKFIAKLKQIPQYEINSRIDNCIKIFELDTVRNAYIYTLSKGFQQRINLAQAVLNNPSILILDEPTNALDTQQCNNFCEFIKLLQRQQTTIIIASHQYTDVIPLCNYMLKISNGSVTKILPPLQNKDIKETNDQLYHST